jgi:hypothetical protein
VVKVIKAKRAHQVERRINQLVKGNAQFCVISPELTDLAQALELIRKALGAPSIYQDIGPFELGVSTTPPHLDRIGTDPDFTYITATEIRDPQRWHLWDPTSKMIQDINVRTKALFLKPENLGKPRVHRAQKQEILIHVSCKPPSRKKNGRPVIHSVYHRGTRIPNNFGIVRGRS